MIQVVCELLLCPLSPENLLHLKHHISPLTIDQQFLGEKLPRSGGPQNVIDGFDEFVLLNILVDCPQSTMKRAREVMCEGHYDQVYGVPSIRSFG